MLMGGMISAQSYTPFYLNDSEWVIKQFTPSGNYLSRYKTKGDTIINSLVYAKVFKKELCLKVSGAIVINTNPETLFAGLREEGKQVFFRSFTSYNPLCEPNEEHLLYDFDTMDGDTIHHCTEESFTISNGDTSWHTADQYAVKRGDSSPVQGLNNHIYHYSRAWGGWEETTSVIEGIGSDYGPFGVFYSGIRDLTCFKHNGESIIYDSCDECPDSTFIDEPKMPFVERKIFPNPARNRVRIEIENGIKIVQVIVFSVDGQKLRTYNNVNRDEFTFYLNSFSNNDLSLINVSLANGETFSEWLLRY